MYTPSPLYRSPHHVAIGLDSGAEITVWPPGLHPGVPTQETSESRRGVKYYGPGDTKEPSLPNLGKRKYQLKIGELTRVANANIVPVRRPLLAMCNLIDSGHDVHFIHDGRCFARHIVTGEEIEIRRVGGRFEIDAEVLNSESTVPFQGQASQL